ncbi:MAG: hypothetical protein ACOX6T_08555 [Myxococcales bacterium]|jgi:hypothetical protein
MSSRVGELLLKAKLVDELQVRSAVAKQNQWGGRLAKHIVEMGFAEEGAVADALAKACGLQRVNLAMMPKDPAALSKIDAAFAEEKGVFPYALRDNGKTLWVAMAEPCDIEIVDIIAARSGCRVRAAVAGEHEVIASIYRHYKNQTPPAALMGATSFRPTPSEALEPMDVTDLQGNDLDVPASRSAPAPFPAYAPPPPRVPTPSPFPASAPPAPRAKTPSPFPAYAPPAAAASPFPAYAPPASAPAPFPPYAPPAAAPSSSPAHASPATGPSPFPPHAVPASPVPPPAAFPGPHAAAPAASAPPRRPTPQPWDPQPRASPTASYASPATAASTLTPVSPPPSARPELPADVAAAVPPAVAAYLSGLHADLEKTSKVLRGLIELCVSKRVFSNEEIKGVIARLAR